MLPKYRVDEANLDYKLSHKTGKLTRNEYILNLKRHNINTTIPDEDYRGANTSIFHFCLIHNFRFKAQPSNIMNGFPCPLCNKEKNRINAENNYKQKLVNENKLVILDDKYISNKEKVYHICLQCKHRWKTSPSYVLKNKFSCPKCAIMITTQNKTMSNEEFRKKVCKIHKNNITVIGDYIGMNHPVEVHCNICTYNWSPIATNIISKHGCPNCKNIKNGLRCKKEKDQYFNELKEIRDDIVFIGEYIDANTPSEHQCVECKHVFLARPSNVLSGYNKCPICFPYHTIKNDYSYDVLLNKQFPNIKRKTQYINACAEMTYECLMCGNIWTYPTAHQIFYKKFGCSNCSPSSLLECCVEDILKRENIEYTRQKKFECLIGVGGRLLSYDFYLPQFNILIECQGIQHEKPIEYFGGEEKFKIQQEHDKRKREYAKEQQIELLEIWYWDFDNIEEILKNNLKLESVTTATSA